MTQSLASHHASWHESHPHVVVLSVDNLSPNLGTRRGRRSDHPQRPQGQPVGLCMTVDDRRTIKPHLTWGNHRLSTIPRPYYKDYPYTHRFPYLNREGTAG